jgi:hypothetical protein
MRTDWDAELAAFLNELSSVQSDLLDLLANKRKSLAAADLASLAALEQRERELTARLQACHNRRGELLRRAAQEGLPGDSLQSLQAALPSSEQAPQMRQAAAQTRLLQHQSLTNWVLTQRTLLYLSQLLEIIGTGGRARPTYGKGGSPGATGALVDRAA